MAVFYRKMPRFDYILPETLNELMAFLKEHEDESKLLAGGTDLIPQLKARKLRTPKYVIDLKAIHGLDFLSYDESGLKIGPLTTIDSIEKSPVIKKHYPCLAQAATGMASPQVRNRGTFAGNICSAVPSADSVPPLIVLGAELKIKGSRGERNISLDQFFTGPRSTVIGPDEILMEISVPKSLPDTRSVYLKLSPRHSMDLAVVGVAAAGSCVKGICNEIRISLGSVAPTPVRAPAAEDILRGRKITTELIDKAAQNAVTQCSPIDDHRASQEYRCDMVYVMTRRALNQIFLL